MRNGRHLHIPRQTSLLLSILLERAGTVVTREEIQNLLWPDGEVIDHEHAINRAVNNLRMVLRDNSQKARFVETFPKRGYRFTAEVTVLPPTESEEVPPAPLELPPAPISIAPPPPALEAADSALVAAPLVVTFPEQIPPAPAVNPPAAVRRRWIAAASVALVLVLGVAGYWAVSHRRPAPPATVSMGVAPFETHGEGAEQLGESFRLDLMDTLSQLPTVQLRASHSLDNIGRDDASIRAISASLHLDLLLLGRFTVQENGNCLLQFELVRGRDAVHLASFQYSGSKDELAVIRDKVQRDIFENLAIAGKTVQAARGSTENPQAYSYYLQARELAYQRTNESLTNAISQYQLAIDRDPAFARAYAGIASAYLVNYDFTNSPADQSKSQLFAEKALQLDPDLAEAHGVLGTIAYHEDWNFALGEHELRRALELEPYQAVYHAWLAELLAIQGQFDEGLHQIDLAHADDPLWPQIYNIESPVASAAREHARSIRAAEKYEEMAPGLPAAHEQLAWAYFNSGQYEQAISQWRMMATIEKDPWRVALEDQGLVALKQGGVAAYAALRLKAISTAPQETSRHPNDFFLAEWYALAGDQDKALAELDRTVSRHDSSSLDLAVNPMFNSLHHDPRFLAILMRVGLKLPASYPSGNAHLLAN